MQNLRWSEEFKAFVFVLGVEDDGGRNCAVASPSVESSVEARKKMIIMPRLIICLYRDAAAFGASHTLNVR